MTFNVNGGSGSVASRSTAAGGYITLPAGPTPPTGQTFAGWYTNPNGGTRVGGAGNSYTPPSSITLYAQWAATPPPPYRVTYDANGGSASRSYDDVPAGGSVTLPSATRPSYTFDGWYTERSGGSRVGDEGASYTPPSDITLYAHWTPVLVTYTVTFNVNGGSGSVPSQDVRPLGSITLPAGPTPPQGKTFAGWYTESSGGTRVGDEGASYTPPSSITLYAQWTTVPTYTVTFNANGGTTPSPSSTMTVTAGGTYGTMPTTSRSGHTFAGWFTAQSGGTRKYAGDALYTQGDHTLWAHWTEDPPYTVTFNVNGGSGNIPSQNVTAGGSITLPSGPPPPTGYTFAGWYTASSGGTWVGGAGDSYTPPSSITLHAHWSAQPQYTLTAYDGYGGIYNTIYRYAGETWPSPGTPPRNGYTFTGWSPNVENTTVTGNASTTAQWSQDSYTVTLNGNGGTPGTQQWTGLHYGDAFPSHTTPTRDGYTFAGWSPGLPGTVTAHFTSSAQWTLITPSYAGGTLAFTRNVAGSGSAATASISYGSITGYALAGGTLPAGLAFSNGVISGTPAEAGTWSVTVRANASNGSSRDAAWTVTVSHAAVSYAGGALTVSNSIAAARSVATAAVADGSAITYTVAGGALPAGLSLAPGGQISGTPDAALGDHTVTVRAAAGGGNPSTKDAVWTITVKEGTFTVTLDFQGGSLAGAPGDTGPKTLTATYGAPMPANPHTAERGHYALSGYFTQPGGLGDKYYNGDGTGARAWDIAAAATLYALWTPEEIPLYFDGGPGGVPALTVETQTQDAPYVLPAADPARANHTFEGWSRAADDWRPSVRVTATNLFRAGEYNLAGQYRVYALWRGAPVPVTYSANGGTLGGTNAALAVYEEFFNTPYAHLNPAPERAEHAFLGWFTAAPAGSGAYVDERSLVSPETAHTLYARWVSVHHRVVFDANGGLPDEQWIDGTWNQPYQVGLAQEPEKEGYDFNGWWTDPFEGYGTNVTAATIDGDFYDHRVWAHWTGRPYPVTLDPNGGIGGEAGVTAVFGSPMPALASLPSRADYELTGYFDAASGGAQYYGPAGESRRAWDKASSGAVLSAQWRGLVVYPGGALTFTNNFLAAGQSAAAASVGDSTITGYEWVSGDLPAGLAPLADGHFSGRPATLEFERVYTNFFRATAANGNSAVAEWHILVVDVEAIPVPVLFSGAGGAPASQPTTQTLGDAYDLSQLTAPVPARAHFTFTGWALEEEGGAAVTAATTVERAAPHTVYAQWLGDPLNVVFHANTAGAAFADGNAEKVVGQNYYSRYVFPDPGPRLAGGYHVGGWYTSASAGDLVTADTRVTSLSDHDLFARWEPNPVEYESGSLLFYKNVAPGTQTVATASVFESDIVSYEHTGGTMLPGLTLNADGSFSGVPSAATYFPVQVKATAANGSTKTVTWYLTTALAPVVWEDGASAFTNRVAAAGQSLGTASVADNAPITYSIVGGTLPAGLGLDAATGVFTGKPGVAALPAEATVTVKAQTDASLNGNSATRTWTVTVIRAPVFYGGGTIAVLAGETVQARLPQYRPTVGTARIDGDNLIEGYTVTGGAFPVGVGLDPAGGGVNGLLYGASTDIGQHPLTVRAAADNGSAADAGWVVHVTDEPVTYEDGETVIYRNVQTNVSVAAATAIGADIVEYGITGGALPGTLQFAPDGTVSGTPTAIGSYTLEVRALASNGFGKTARRVIRVVNAPVVYEGGTVVFTNRIHLAAGGISWKTAAVAGSSVSAYIPVALSLPAGVFHSNGVLSGMPDIAEAGTHTFTNQVMARAANGSTATAIWIITVVPQPVIAGPGPHVPVEYPPGSGVTNLAEVVVFTNGVAAAGQTVATATTAADGPGGIAYTLADAAGLPPGIAYNADGTFSGTTTAAGWEGAILVHAVTPGGAEADLPWIVRVVNAPVVYSGRRLTAYADRFAELWVNTATVAGSTVTNYTLTGSGTEVAPGMYFANDGSGRVYGTPSHGIGEWWFDVTAHAANGESKTTTWRLLVTDAPLIYDGGTLVFTNGVAAAGQTFGTASKEGFGPEWFIYYETYEQGYTLFAQLGLEYDHTDGTLRGTPTADGTFYGQAIVLFGEDGGASDDSRLAQWTIIVLPPVTYGDDDPGVEPRGLGGVGGTLYFTNHVAAAGQNVATAVTYDGAAVSGYAVTNGVLQLGLTLNADGTVTGTPTAEGSAEIVVEVTTSTGYTASARWVVVVLAGEAPPEPRYVWTRFTAISVDPVTGVTDLQWGEPDPAVIILGAGEQITEYIIHGKVNLTDPAWDVVQPGINPLLRLSQRDFGVYHFFKLQVKISQ